MTERQAAVADHPLAPLTLEEVREAVGIVREERDLGPRHRFAGLTLNEPPKEDVLAFEDGDAFEREALAVILDGNDGSTYEAVISLSRGAVTSWTHIPDIQPPIVLEEFDECEAACKESPEFQEALRKRGIEDMDRVLVDPWWARAAGSLPGLPLGDGRPLRRPASRTVAQERIRRGRVQRRRPGQLARARLRLPR